MRKWRPRCGRRRTAATLSPPLLSEASLSEDRRTPPACARRTPPACARLGVPELAHHPARRVMAEPDAGERTELQWSVLGKDQSFANSDGSAAEGNRGDWTPATSGDWATNSDPGLTVDVSASGGEELGGVAADGTVMIPGVLSMVSTDERDRSSSHGRERHSAAPTSPSILKRLLNGEGGAAE